jgi:hypothetical protein
MSVTGARTWRGTVARIGAGPAALALATAVLVTASPPAGAQTRTAPTMVRVGHALSDAVSATAVASPLQAPEGPGTVLPRTVEAPVGTPGEGIVWLTMDSPGTSWSSAANTSVVADVSVDAGVSQQMVLFAGASPFTYTGFTGPLTVGPHTVHVTVDPDLSHVSTVAPTIELWRLTLGVLPTTDPDYDAVAYAPVLYGRHSSARAYTPLMTSAADTPGPGGSHDLAYVLVISAHDQGDSIVPAYQWGLWGRMTDIVSILDETVSSSGAVSDATYASCGCESIPFFPDSVMAPEETTAPVRSTPYFTHPVLRDASATNYLSDEGTTPFRFQQLPVAAPPPGQVREAMMDEHPWSYQISNEELPREHLISTDPDTLAVGDYRQYAIIDSDLTVTGTVAVEFDLQLAGSPTWYSTDYRQMTAGVPSTFTFNNGGHNRTAIKLPLSWQGHPISGFRIRLEVAPGSTTAPSVVVHSLEVLAVTSIWTVQSMALPAVSVATSTSLDPEPLPS